MLFNNGGFQPDIYAKGCKPRELFSISTKVDRPFLYGSLVKPSMGIYYPPDGTGRDSYIKANDGGTKHTAKSNAIAFSPMDNSYLRSKYETPRMN